MARRKEVGNNGIISILLHFTYLINLIREAREQVSSSISEVRIVIFNFCFADNVVLPDVTVGDIQTGPL